LLLMKVVDTYVSPRGCGVWVPAFAGATLKAMPRP
jgi:hypothetical protein